MILRAFDVLGVILGVVDWYRAKGNHPPARTKKSGLPFSPFVPKALLLGSQKIPFYPPPKMGRTIGVLSQRTSDSS